MKIKRTCIPIIQEYLNYRHRFVGGRLCCVQFGNFFTERLKTYYFNSCYLKQMCSTENKKYRKTHKIFIQNATTKKRPLY